MSRAEGVLPGNTTAWVVTDGKIGDEVQCFGLASALGLEPERRLIAPRRLFAALMPWGPVDPREAAHRPGSPIAPPWPDLLIASGRRTVPYMRFVRKASRGRTFTVFLKDPYTGAGTADVICLPAHDTLRGDNVVVALTLPHGLTRDLFEAARAQQDPRLAHLPHPRLGLMLGGVSAHFSFTDGDAARLAAIAVQHAVEGYGVMVTPSRRTPPELLEAMRTALETAGLLGARAFVWDRSGTNPYANILALADALIVTGDSVNMVGEAVFTGKPVHVYVPGGKGHPKMTLFLDRLVAAGAVRRYRGVIEDYAYEAVDSTPFFARAVAEKYARWRKTMAINWENVP